MEGRIGRDQLGPGAGLIIEIEWVLRRPAEILFELLPVGADLGRPLNDPREDLEIGDAADINAGRAHRFVHRHLLGRPLDVVVHPLGLDLGQQLVADKAAGQLAVVHQARGRRQRAQQIHVADHRDIGADLLEIAEQFERLSPIPAHLRDEEFRPAGDLLFHPVVLLHLGRLGVLERRDGRPREEPPDLSERLRLGPKNRVVVDLLDQPQQVERFNLEDPRRFHRLVARQRQDAFDTCLSQAHQRTDDGVGVHVLAGHVRHDVEPIQQAFALTGGDHAGRLDVRDAAGALGQRDRGEIKSRRDRGCIFAIRLEELLDRIEAEPESARQFRQNHEAGSLHQFVFEARSRHGGLQYQSAPADTTPARREQQNTKSAARPLRNHSTDPGQNRVDATRWFTARRQVGIVHHMNGASIRLGQPYVH